MCIFICQTNKDEQIDGHVAPFFQKNVVCTNESQFYTNKSYMLFIL